MKKSDLERMADRYQAKADKAYQNYQETGTGRYDREYRNNEDLAMALRMAATASDDHNCLISMRCDVATLGAKAENLLKGDQLSHEFVAGAASILEDVVAVASTYGLVRRDAT